MSAQDLARYFVDALFDEAILDIATSEHLVALRRRSACELCGGSCNAGVCGPSTSNGIASSSGARATSPAPSSSKNETVYYDCLVCKRAIGSARYAQHLSNCMGFSGRGRTSKRAAALSSTNSYSSGLNGTKSPYVSSDDEEDLGPKKKNGIKRAASPLPGRPPKKPNLASSSLGPGDPVFQKTATSPAKPSPFNVAAHAVNGATQPNQISRKGLIPSSHSSVPVKMAGGPGLAIDSSSGEEEASEDSDPGGTKAPQGVSFSINIAPPNGSRPAGVSSVPLDEGSDYDSS